MYRDKVTERPDLLQGHLLHTEGGRDLWRNDGVIPYGLGKSERESRCHCSLLALVLLVTAATYGALTLCPAPQLSLPQHLSTSHDNTTGLALFFFLH